MFWKLTVLAALAVGFVCIGVPTRAAPFPDCGSGGNVIEYGYSGTIVTCSIVSGGHYSLFAIGANGGDQRIDDRSPSTFGGRGAGIGGPFALQEGDILQILVGGAGQTQAPHYLADEVYPGGGGGGTFIILQRAGEPLIPLLIAGGGGGAGTASAGREGRGVEGNSGVPNGDGQYDYAGQGGLYGNGGGGATTAAGGAGGGGFYGDGGSGPSSYGGQGFVNGGAGGGPYPAEFCFGAAGGFGGGGGAGWSDCTQSSGAGAGGGGFSGGGGWEFWGNNGGAGGGGSSFYDVGTFVFWTTPLIVEPGYNPFPSGNGQVLIQQLTRDDGTLVPEPGSLALLAASLAGLGVVMRRRRTGGA